jgi:uncharacterized protein YeaO (DUF488 family)
MYNGGWLMAVGLKRAYDKPAKADGYRVLVDRLWPRGISKSEARIDLWLKEIAPSRELRKWFAHDPHKWAGFKKRYFNELDERNEEVQEVVDKARKGRVTLVYAAKDEQNNNAVALKEYLQDRFGL